MTIATPVSLHDLKSHLRLPTDAYDDDALLDQYAIAAAQLIERETGRKLDDLRVGAKGELPQILTQAIYLVVGHYYENREATTDRRINAVPLAVGNILAGFARPEVV